MWRIVDIGGYGYSLRVSDNKLVVAKEDDSTSIPFRDINSIIIHCDCQISGKVFQECINNTIPILFCDEKHVPSGLFSSFNQNEDSARRFEIQLNASKPRRKQAWAQLIKEKLKNQALVLEKTQFTQEAKEILFLSEEVLSGDTTNREAVGAKLYFSSLFGENFTRGNPDIEINGLLNYGYTIIRALVARAVSGLGLYPGFGVFHSNRKNPYALVDDLMEPIRPLADREVLRIIDCGAHTLDPASKRELMSMINKKVLFHDKHYALSEAIQHMIMTYIQFLEGNNTAIVFPDILGTHQ